MEKLLALVGPTAIGKTSLSLKIAEALDCEIISGDAVQVYKNLDIGSAKIGANEMKGIPHHLIDIIDAKEDFTAALFKEEAEKKVVEISDRNHIPFLVGGSGLYINGFLYRYHFSEKGKNEEVRIRLQKELDEKGNDYLFQRLKSKDPKAANRLSVNDSHRIIRALEVIETTGKLFSDNHNMIEKYDEPRYSMLYFALEMDRKCLYERINLRVDKMVEEGLFEEVEMLLGNGLSPQARSMQAIGYKQVVDHLLGRCSRKEAIDTIKLLTRRFAKRQFTWFRRDPNIQWINRNKFSDDEVVAFIVKSAQRKWS